MLSYPTTCGRWSSRFCRMRLRSRKAGDCAPRVGRRGVESSERLGHYRWIVERTLAWLACFRRLAIRYERRADLHLAFTTLACALICQAQAKRICPCLLGYIDSFFDPLRRHSALGYRSLFVYEQETAPEPLSQAPCTVNKYGTIPPAMIPKIDERPAAEALTRNGLRR